MAATYDGSIRISTKIDTAGAKTGLASLTKSLKTFAVTVGLAFATTAIVSFGKSCIDLASDLNEVKNVVDTTFGSAASQIYDFAETADTAFGMSELAAEKYTGTLGAMLKSMGFGTQAAADMSIAVAGLAGDMASFYNLSTDEAFEKIRSGISGETEPLKQLGVNLSEANLSAFALAEGMGAAYSKMTEQEKALTRYNYLMSVTAAAQGDFAKTSNSWANQVRVLKLQWDSLKATLGGAFIQLLTPVLRMINSLISSLSAAATVFANFVAAITGHSQTATTAATTASDAMDGLADSTDAAGAAAEKSGKKAGKGLANFDELNTLSSASTGAAAGAGGISTVAEETVVATEDTGSAVDTTVENMRSAIDGFFATYQDEIARVKAAWFDLGQTVLGIVTQFSSQWSAVNIGGAAFELVVNLMYAIIETANLVIGVIGNLFIALNVPLIVQNGLRMLSDLFAAIGNIIAAITPGIMAFVNTALVPIAEWIGGKIADAFAFLGEQFKKIGDWFTEHEASFTIILGFLGEIVGAIWDIIEPLGDAIWDATKTMIGDLIDILLTIIGVIVDLVAKAITVGITFGDVWAGIKEVWGAVATWFNDVVVTPIANFFGGLWTGIKSGASVLASFIKDYVITPIVELFKGLYDSLVGIMEGVVNGFISIINAFIRGLNSVIKTINKIPGVKLSSIGSLDSVSIPRLAQGAVIPPNREFMAVLGDQKSGTNIETPLATMIEAFKAAISDMGGTGGDITITMPVYLDNEKIYEGQQKVQRRRGATLVIA